MARETIGSVESQKKKWISDETYASLITEDGECTMEFRTRLNRGQAIGASLQKIWKTHGRPSVERASVERRVSRAPQLIITNYLG